MALTTAQQATLKAAILADGVLNALPNNSDGAFEIAAQLNAQASPDFYVWRSTTSTDIILNNVVWANMTPLDAPDGTQLWMNRALACQGKQFNVQTMLVGRTSVPSGKTTFRNGLQDALTNIPAGAGGALIAAGWIAVRDSMKRLANRVEQVFATGGNGALATPADLAFEGSVSYQDVYTARNS